MHLLSYTAEELTAAAPDLAVEGYAVAKVGCFCPVDATGSGAALEGICYCVVTSVDLLCPACTKVCDNRLDLKAYLEAAYVSLGYDLVPFRRRILALVRIEAIDSVSSGV